MTNEITKSQAVQCSTLRPEISKIASQLEAVCAGRGFFNIALLRRNGLIDEKRELLHAQTYTIPTGRTIWHLTAKGRAMLNAANTALLSVGGAK